MWKPSKKTLLVLMILMSSLGGISLSMVNWEIFNTAKGIEIYREINLSLIFIVLAFYFMFPYVKKLKEEREN